jgi:hypothetical protein
MIKTTYTSPRSGNTSRYVAKDAVGAGYHWCEQCDKTRFDLAQGTCDADDLPDDVKQAADELKNTWPNYVVWPKVSS